MPLNCPKTQQANGTFCLSMPSFTSNLKKYIIFFYFFSCVKPIHRLPSTSRIKTPSYLIPPRTAWSAEGFSLLLAIWDPVWRCTALHFMFHTPGLCLQTWCWPHLLGSAQVIFSPSFIHPHDVSQGRSFVLWTRCKGWGNCEEQVSDREWYRCTIQVSVLLKHE